VPTRRRFVVGPWTLPVCRDVSGAVSSTRDGWLVDESCVQSRTTGSWLPPAVASAKGITVLVKCGQVPTSTHGRTTKLIDHTSLAYRIERLLLVVGQGDGYGQLKQSESEKDCQRQPHLSRQSSWLWVVIGRASVKEKRSY
jgi:hypothetical protein